MTTFDEIRDMLRDTLMLEQRADDLRPDTKLYGGMPDFDSVAVVSVIAAIEERFGCEVDDEEISADVFATVGTLHDFVARKTASEDAG